MIKYNQALELAGFLELPEKPTEQYTYFAYKAGEGREFSTMADAKEFSSITERVVVNKKEIDEWKVTRHAIEAAAFDTWYDGLREEYAELPVAVFNLCYSKAYDKGHHAGCDRVAECMIDVVDFAHEIMKAVK